jgi:hypothetical protein
MLAASGFCSFYLVPGLFSDIFQLLKLRGVNITFQSENFEDKRLLGRRKHK